ncbi:MAG: hypothetical protein QG635_1396, partial [Bacteroidota bacterium]|nr:hypothetical protein [Bacteroidota bacterium]
RAALQTIYIPDSKAGWKNKAIKAAEKLLNQYDINTIFATAPPFTDFLIAAELSKKFNKPFIIDYRDAWVDNPFHFYPTPFHKIQNIKLESETLRKAAKVIVTTRQAKENLIKRYRFMSYDDISIIPHGFDPEDFMAVKDITPNPQKFTITHSGVFQDNRTPKYFLEALSQFLSTNKEAKDRVEARFVGLMRKSHLKLIKKYGLENNVVNTGYIPHIDAVRQLQESDVLWFMLEDKVRTPGKLFEYIGANRTILACCPDSIIRRIALDTNAALAADPKNVKEIKNALANLYEQWKHKRLPKPDSDYRAGFDRSKLTSELSRELSLAAYI